MQLVSSVMKYSQRGNDIKCYEVLAKRERYVIAVHAAGIKCYEVLAKRELYVIAVHAAGIKCYEVLAKRER